MTADHNAPQGALGREVERTARQLDRVERLLRLLSAEITGLRERIDATLPAEPEMRAWLEVEDTAQAHEDLADLTDWLARIQVRYPDAGLVSCWAWHPAVVEELWWLRCAHHDAYHGPHASPAKVGDWHDRQRPGVVRRLRAWLRDCDLARHAAGAGARAVPLAGSTDRLADAWSQHRTTPAPTPEEITEVGTHDRHEHRTSHR